MDVLKEGRRALELIRADYESGPDISLEDAKRKLPGWLLWRTRNHMSADTYSARLEGTRVAAPGRHGMARLDVLVKAVKEYEANVGEHIEETRRELSDTPASWIGRVEMLRERLTALAAHHMSGAQDENRRVI